MATYKKRPLQTDGFTLVELLVVIAIIGVLVALLLPAVQMAREAARRTQCTNNLRQVGIACHTYHDAFRTFAPGRLVYDGTNSSGAPTKVVTGFLAMILPFVEEAGIEDIYNQEYGFDDIANQTAVNKVVNTYLCPSTPGSRITPVYAGWNVGWTTNVAAMPDLTGVATDYQGVRGLHFVDHESTGLHVWDDSCGILTEAATSMSAITDGTSHTILLFEMAGKPKHYNTGHAQPDPTNAQFYGYGPWAGNTGVGIYNWLPDGSSKGCDTCETFVNVDNEAAPYSFHPGVVSIMLADGSSRTLSETVASQTFIDLCRKDDGHRIKPY